MSAKQASWYLRKPDGSEYGPVTTSELQRWATQCRIVAGNGVSADRENWQHVEDIPELEMDWVAHRPDGREFGPFNITAARELFEHDMLTEDAILTHRTTHETVTVQQALNGGLPEAPKTEAPSPAPTPAAKKQMAQEKKPPPPAKKAKVEEAKPTPAAPAEAATSPAAVDTPAEAEPETPPQPEDTPEVAELKQKLEKLQERLKTTQLDFRQVRKEFDNANAETVEMTSALQEERDEATQALAALQEAMGQLGEQHLAEMESLTRKLASAKAARTKAAETVAQQLAAAEAAHAQTAESLAEAESQLENIEAERGEAEHQALQSMAELRKQTAFMKKNNATLQFEFEAVQAKAAQRGKWLAIILGVLGLTGGAALLLMPRSCVSTPSPTAPTDASVESGVPYEEPALPTPNSEPPPPPVGRRAATPDARAQHAAAKPTPVAWPKIMIEGVKMRPGKDACSILFDAGVFTRLTTPSPAAKAQLLKIANILRPQISRFQITVEGHTDDQPLRPTAAYDGNYALGLARAEAIREWLITKGELPGHAIRAMSSGGRTPPYPNDSPANRVRNRTVVLKLVRK
jgi:flagellar motor protein MotB